jgi:hypothetical protein
MMEWLVFAATRFPNSGSSNKGIQQKKFSASLCNHEAALVQHIVVAGNEFCSPHSAGAHSCQMLMVKVLSCPVPRLVRMGYA